MRYEIVEDERTPVERRLHLRVDAESVEAIWRDELRRLARETAVPGFRPGKAPLNLVERRLGREAVWTRVREAVVERVLGDLLAAASPAPLAPPTVEYGQGGDESGEESCWEAGETFEFRASYLLPPPSPEEIERELMRGRGAESGERVAGQGGPASQGPIIPPDPRSLIPGSGNDGGARPAPGIRDERGADGEAGEKA
jgi:hypothetical protein